MKFVNITSAKISIGQIVFTKNEKGEHGLGKFVERSESANGIKWTFEKATFTQEGQPPAIKPTLVTDITMVFKFKDAEMEEGE